jgi:uncharacterized protein involved in exopolysaccharide biosynthesis
MAIELDRYVAAPNAPSRPASRLTPRQFLSIVFRDGRKIGLAFLIPMTLATVAAFIPQKRYEATAFLLVRPGREYVYRPEVDTNAAPVTYDLDHSVTSELEILTSRSVQEKALQTFGIERMYPRIAADSDEPDLSRLDKAIIEMQKRLDAIVIKDSSVVQITFQHPDRHLAADALNFMVDEYLRERRSIMADPRSTFEQAEVDATRQKLGALEGKIAEFKRQNHIFKFDDQRTLLLQQRGALDEKRKETEVAVASASAKLGALTAGLAAVSSATPLYADTTPDDAINNVQKVLLDLNLQRQDAVSKYGEKSSYVQSLERQIQQADATLKDLQSNRQNTVRTGRSPVRDSLENDMHQATADLHANAAGKATLDAQLASVGAELRDLGDREVEMASMERERTLLEDTYQSYVKRLQEARINDQLDQEAKTNVTVIQRALLPIAKKNLTPVILGVGALLSVAIALSVAFFSETLRDSFLSPEEVTASLELPVVGWFPDSKRALGGRRPWRWRARAERQRSARAKA